MSLGSVYLQHGTSMACSRKMKFAWVVVSGERRCTGNARGCADVSKDVHNADRPDAAQAHEHVSKHQSSERPRAQRPRRECMYFCCKQKSQVLAARHSRCSERACLLCAADQCVGRAVQDMGRARQQRTAQSALQGGHRPCTGLMTDVLR